MTEKCKSIFDCTPKEWAKVISTLIVALFIAGMIFSQFKNLIFSVGENKQNYKTLSAEVKQLKLDFSVTNERVKSIDERTKNSDDKITEVWKHLLHKK